MDLRAPRPLKEVNKMKADVTRLEQKLAEYKELKKEFSKAIFEGTFIFIIGLVTCSTVNVFHESLPLMIFVGIVGLLLTATGSFLTVIATISRVSIKKNIRTNESLISTFKKVIARGVADE